MVLPNSVSNINKRVALGLSGGVDSSVSASLLLDQGYDVTGVFLECWESGRPGCRVDQDRKDALDIALKLGIPFQVLDFKKAYNDRVLEYFYTEYRAGRTPNPDTLCNREIKFGLFYEWGISQQGFDYIATGHYARILRHSGQSNLSMTDSESIKINSWILNQVQDDEIAHYYLQRGKDEKKDQSYFLYQLRLDQLEYILFPIGHLQKEEVRQIAKEKELATATKPDSQGICFIGNVDVSDFLKERIEEKIGKVVIRLKVDELMSERVNEISIPINPLTPQPNNISTVPIGTHNGVSFHTIGQKVGREIDQALVAKLSKKGILSFDPTNMPPLFVIEKDIENNVLIVGTEDQTYKKEFEVGEVSWLIDLDSQIVRQSDDQLNSNYLVIRLSNYLKNLHVRIRHGGELIKVKKLISLTSQDRNLTTENKFKFILDKPVRGVASGQACVIYSSNSSDAIVLGGGVIL